MKRITTCLLIYTAMLFIHSALAQNEPEKSGSFTNGKLLIRVELSWNEEQKARLSGLFMLDSLLMQAIFEQNTDFINDSTEWTAVIGKAGVIELTKSLESDTDRQFENIILSDLPRPGISPPPPVIPVVFGANDLKDERVFSYQDGMACFFLPLHSQAKSVYLSGSFNYWSTMQLPMHRSDSGWVTCLSLPPGKHLYKYIVDGRWIQDPNNRLRERDGNRGYNSIVYACNVLFSLEGHHNARRVSLAGSFNNWKPGELMMKKTRAGWELPLYVREGTHTYKYVVDNNWIPDPANPVQRDDGAGNINSVIAIGDTLMFSLKGHADADRVILSGNFNAWNTRELVMEKRNGIWQLPYVLGPGNYEYKYIVDGIWITDPDNPFTRGQGDFINSLRAFKPNHVFELSSRADAKTVIVTGSFNGWNTGEYRMVLKDGKWVFPIYLIPGRYTYKFIVDGEWITDPDNPLWEENEFGTGNSVLWIDL
jgi:hypothetical protein